MMMVLALKMDKLSPIHFQHFIRWLGMDKAHQNICKKYKKQDYSLLYLYTLICKSNFCPKIEFWNWFFTAKNKSILHTKFKLTISSRAFSIWIFWQKIDFWNTVFYSKRRKDLLSFFGSFFIVCTDPYIPYIFCLHYYKEQDSSFVFSSFLTNDFRTELQRLSLC